MRSIPEQSPVDGGTLICGGCGKPMTMEVKMGRKGVQTLRYECRNKEAGCSYGFDRKTFVNAEMKAIRDDGSVVNVPDARM